MSVLSTQGPLPPRGRLRYSGVWRLYWIRLRRRWPQELLAAVGIAVGVALLFASQIASTSLSASVEQLADGIAGNSQLQVLAHGSEGFPERTAEQVRRLPGVRTSAPMVQVQVNLLGPRGKRGVTLFGADPRVLELRGSLLQGMAGSAAATQRTLVLPEPVAASVGVRFGDVARLQIAGRTAAAPVGIFGRDRIGTLADATIALAPLRFAQELAGMEGRYTRILVEASPGRLEEVRSGLERISGGRLNVVPTDYEARLFASAAAPTDQATTLFSVLSALVGFLFALCAMLVTAASRIALADDLRRSGFRRAQVIQIVLLDALMLGAVAGAVGLGLGDLLSRQGFRSDVSFLSGAFPIGDQRIVTWSSVAIALGGGLVAAALGVLTPLRQLLVPRTAGRRREARTGASPRASLGRIAGVGCLVGSLLLSAFAPDAAVIGLVVLALALVLLLPTIFDLALGLLARINRCGRGGWIPVVQLALPQLRARDWRVRSLAIATTGAIAVFGAVSLEGARQNLQSGLDRLSAQLSASADLWVSPYGAGDEFASSTFRPSDIRGLEATPGIRAVSVYRSGFLDIAGQRAWVMAPPDGRTPPVPAEQILDGDVDQASSRLREGGWVAISRGLAEAQGLRPGDRVRLPAPNPIVLRVAALTTNLGWPGGAIALSSRDYARGWGSTTASAIHLQLAPGVSPKQGRDAVAARLGPQTALRVETSAARSQRQQASAQNGLTRLSQVTTLTLVAAILAMAATIAGLLWQQRRIVAREKLDGHRTRRMWGALFVEGGTLIVTGCLAGAAFAIPGQILSTRGVQAVTGFPVVQGIQLGTLGWSLAFVVGASLLVIAVPGYLVARVRPSLRG